ncbi:MAG TPA: ATP-binding protein [Solirubrobacteraceae bacterium]|jgi:PAS domain S-box-containing protein|nr:ATP-binding protein [Solirubrobacteraceae bacterium]
MISSTAFSRPVRWTLRLLWACGLGGLVVFTAAAVGGPGDPGSDAYQALYMALYLVAGALCLLRALLVAQQRLTWAAFGVAMCCSAAAVGWIVVLDGLYSTPDLSWNDALSLTFHGASFVALVTLMRSGLTRFHGSVWVDVAVGALAIAAIAATLLVRPIVASTDGSLIEVATNLAFPLFDVLIVSVVFAVFVINDGRPGRVWLLLGAGWVLHAIADTLYTYQVANGTYASAGPIDATWPPLVLLIAFAAWQRPVLARRVWERGLGALALTISFAGVGLFVLTYGHWHDIDDAAVVLATLTLLCAFVWGVVTFGGMSALARSREMLLSHQSILNAAGDGIVGIDADGIITFANPAAASMVGYGLDELVEHDLHSLLHHTKADGSPYVREDCPVLASLGDGSIRRCDDDVYWRKDETWFAVSYTSTPLVDGSRTTGAVVVFRDVTAHRESQRAKDQFISIVSHELRTPLTSVRASLGLLESGALGPLPGEGTRMIQIAVRNTDRLVRLINDLLDLGRFDSETMLLRRGPCDAAELVARAIEAVTALAIEAGVTLEVDALPAGFTADADRLIQTLTNLISNAVKFSAPGATVWIAAERRHDEIRFAISDRGRGIPTHKLETIFGRFVQVDASDARRKGGTGLGLAICRSIVEQHGGVIWAESRPGEGSVLTFLIPADAPATQAVTATLPLRDEAYPPSLETDREMETAHEAQAHPAGR